MEIVRVKNTKFRDALMNHTDGETVYCEEENQCFVWNDNKWHLVESEVDGAGEIKVNYRDLVIGAISGFDPLDMEACQKYQVLLNKWDEAQYHEYYMLYARELDYFTLLRRTEPADDICCLGKEILECLNTIGEIIYVEEFNDDDISVIFWIRTDTGLITEAYLFDYTAGVVPFA